VAEQAGKMESLVMHDIRTYYKGKKIFVTGHTGFKGTWMTAILHHLGAIVKGYALAPEDSAKFYQLFTDLSRTDSVIADIRDKEKLKAEILSFQPDFIFHLAAQPLVLRSYEIPAETFEVNVVGTANILEAIKDLNKKCTVVVITTDKVYENKEAHSILYHEEDALGGYDPYSASKAATEIVVSSFRNSFFNIQQYQSHQKAIASARAGNVIGGGDWSRDRIIPDTATALLNGKPIKVRNPGSVRPWQHVLEPLIGYLSLGASLDENPLAFSKPFNFGPHPEDHLTVKELVELAIQVWGKGSMEVNTNNNQPHEANLLKLDIKRALTELKWKPKLDAREAIRWTIDWYKKDTAHQAAFTFEQINNYLSQ
jgi:CDP-glucose 4,6-dehydratase